jgi:hypothetical protein
MGQDEVEQIVECGRVGKTASAPSQSGPPPHTMYMLGSRGRSRTGRLHSKDVNQQAQPTPKEECGRRNVVQPCVHFLCSRGGTLPLGSTQSVIGQ